MDPNYVTDSISFVPKDDINMLEELHIAYFYAGFIAGIETEAHFKHHLIKNKLDRHFVFKVKDEQN